MVSGTIIIIIIIFVITELLQVSHNETLEKKAILSPECAIFIYRYYKRVQKARKKNTNSDK